MTISRYSRAAFGLIAALAVLPLAGHGRAAEAPQTAPAAGQAALPGTAPLAATIPMNPQVTAGTLPNGLHYFIRANKKPEDRAELRLVVNAGSVLEAADQRGLAHFVEHMAFNGTEHFPKQELESFLESIGMRFGQDLNAYTSFDETVYMLQVPTDKPEVLSKAFQVLEDWAHNVTFDADEVVKERGVITEEWRLGRGADARMRDKQFPILLAGSRYADRLPIGDMDVVQHATKAQVTKFYDDWYRPDLMSVIAVGDFDAAAIERIVKTDFTPIAEPASPKPRPTYDVPDHPGTRYAIATDKEAAGTSVTVYHLSPAPDQTTVGAYRQQIVEGLFGSMLSARYTEIAQKPDAPFLGAGASRGSFVRTEDASSLGAAVKDGGVEQGLDALFTEAARVARFGFTASELDRQKQRLMSSIDHAVAEKDNADSGDLADELVRHATDREPAPGIVYESGLYHRFLPQITLAEVNALAKDWVPDDNRVVVVSAPEKAGVAVPDEKQLAAVMDEASTKDLTPYVDTVDAQPLVPDAPTPGTVVKASPANTYGITEWTLSNGVHVVLKPTTFKADDIEFRASSPGGLSLASDADYIAARTASIVVPAGGLGTFSAIDLRKALAGKVAGVRVGFTDTDDTLSGNASKKDLETMFQLIYLTFTAPRADPAMFGVIVNQLEDRAGQPGGPAGVRLR